MITYKDSFKDRAKAGNPGEDACISYYEKKKGVHFIKYGLDLMDAVGVITGKDFVKMGSFVTATPDYITIGKSAKLVEAKYGGQVIRMKLKDLKEYYQWNKKMPVEIFCYSTKRKDFTQVRLEDIIHLIKKYKYPVEMYHDNGKEYYPIPFEDLKKYNTIRED